MENLILSYEDSCLYESDLKILQNETAWLNDRIISFYFEYLHKEIYESDEILFIGPEVTQAIKLMGNPDEINAIILEPLKCKSRQFIIFAINDNENTAAAGGSHWSLCVYSKPDNTFFHFDSSHNFNHFPCESLVNIIKKCLKIQSADYQRVDCLQQNNSYDCGIYVLCHSDLACKTIMKSKSLKDIKKLNWKSITTKRSELIQIIETLKS